MNQNRSSAPMPLGSVDTSGEDVYAPLRSKGFAKDSTLLLFDARHACYRSFYTRDLSAPDGTPTSCLHGLIELAQAACEAANTSRFLFVWDGSVAYKRAIYPQYKCRHDRSRTPEEQVQHDRCKRAIVVAQEGISALGFPQLFHPELEADDLIGLVSSSISRSISRRGGQTATGIARTVCVTDDKDHYQLLDDNTFVWRGVAKVLMDAPGFVRQFGFSPERYVVFKALFGENETGDNIPGVDGFGETTAMKYVAVHGDLEDCIRFASDRVAVSKPKPHKVDVNLHTQQDRARISFRLSRIMRVWDDVAAAPSRLNPQAVADLCAISIKNVTNLRLLSYRALLDFNARYGFTSIDPQTFASRLGFTLRSV